MTSSIPTPKPTNMRSTSFASFCMTVCALAMAAPALAQQSPPRPAPAQPATTPVATRPGQPVPVETPAPAAAQTRRSGPLPQGFSVVLVLGDIQSAATADDVPPAARKALVDMREFLPFKSYKLLDAAWVMCCSTGGHGSASQVLRGPEDVEYELRLETARFESSRLSVRFSLRNNPNATVPDAAEVASGAGRTTARRLANLKDQRALMEKQIVDARKRVEVGVSPATDVAKLELELRRVEREILELEETAVHAANQRAALASARGRTPQAVRSAIIDTSFTMDVGETVVVGTSRLKGGSKALIALLTAVPPRTTERRE